MRAEDIDALLEEGIPFEAIEDRIEQTALADEARALLWLYAWSYQPRDEQRRVIGEMIASLATQRR